MHKDIRSRQIREQIRVSSDQIDDINPGYQHKLGFGRVNAYNALTRESPAIQISSVWVSDSVTGNRNCVFELGETVRISMFLTNYLKPSGSKTVSFYGDPQNITILNSTITWTSELGTLQTTLIPITFDVKLSQSIPINTRINCLVTISAGTYNDYCPLFFVVNPPVQNNNINNITMSFCSAGNIGFDDYPNNLEGLGFRYKTTGANNYLFEGGLMIGTDTVNLYDCVHGNELNVADRDFSSIKKYELFTPGSFADQQGSGEFNTSYSVPSYFNLYVKYSTYAWANPPNDNIVFVCYSIINTSFSAIFNMYAGMYLDWDIGTYNKNITSVDTTLRLGYAYDSQQGDTAIYVGIVMLGTKPLAYRAMNNDTNKIGKFGMNDIFTKTEKWDALHNGISSPMAGPKDISMVIGCGPFTFNPYQTASMPLAFVAARGLDSLKRVAKQAISLWHTVNIQNNHPDLSTLEQNFPNPFNSETTIRYLLPTAGTVSLKVYDILGREIAVLVDQYQQRGIYVISFPGRKNISSGIYFYRLTAAGSTDVKKMILVK